MANIRTIDMMFLDDLFEMNGGYVLNFSNNTFAKFFAEELNIDIDDVRYAQQGGSKGKRLRNFLQTVDKASAVKTLNALWEYREAARIHFGHEEKLQNPHGRLLALINRLESEGASTPHKSQPAPAFDRGIFRTLHDELSNCIRSRPSREALLSRSS